MNPADELKRMSEEKAPYYWQSLDFEKLVQD